MSIQSNRGGEALQFLSLKLPIQEFEFYEPPQESIIMQDITFSLYDEMMVHKIITYNLSELIIDLGGSTFALYIFLWLLVQIFTSDKVTSLVVTTFFRKPEMYKYALAEKLDYNLVVRKKMTIEQYNE